MAFATSWTSEKVHQVEQLLFEQKSHRAISEVFGVSARAVTHVVDRHHLQPRPVVAKPKPIAKPQRITAFRNIAAPLPARCARDLPIETSPRAASFVECTACMWPIGNRMFCNRGKFSKSSYCWKHHKRSRLAA